MYRPSKPVPFYVLSVIEGPGPAGQPKGHNNVVCEHPCRSNVHVFTAVQYNEDNLTRAAPL